MLIKETKRKHPRERRKAKKEGEYKRQKKAVYHMGRIFHYGKGYKETMCNRHNEPCSFFDNHGYYWSLWKDK